MGENPALSDPNLNRRRQALNDIEFLVVQDIFLTETAEYADVVLPSACFAEKDGTFTNSERRVQRVRKAVDPPGEARPDWQIICDVSTAMGYPMHYDSASDVFDEMASLYGRPGKKSPRRRVQEESIQPPCREDRSSSPKQSRRQRKRKRDSSQTKHNGNLPAGFKW